MESIAKTTVDHNEVLREFLALPSEKDPMEILQEISAITPQLSPAEFLSRLPYPEQTILQFFDDSPAKDPKKALAIPLKPGWEETAAAKQETGCGVFFSVNAFTGKRRKEALTHVRAHFLDTDVAKEGECPLAHNALPKLVMFGRLLDGQRAPIPHVITETKNGLQALWIVDEGYAPTDATYEGIQLSLIRRLLGDLGAKDVTRVLRLPGFLHLKNPAEPFPVRFLYHDLP